MDENIRFIQLLDELKRNGLITDYVQVSAQLGTNKAGISDIKSGRKKLSIELLRRLKSSYPNTSIDWIIMGEGEPFINTNASMKSPQSETSFFVDKITEQAEEIGFLKARIQELEREKGKSVSDAPTSDIANVG